MPCVLLAHRCSARQGSAHVGAHRPTSGLWSRPSLTCFNVAVSKVILMAAGACLELLFVVLPLTHLGQWASPPPAPWIYGVAAVPLVLTCAAIVNPIPRLTVGLVPLSHLPLLMIEPRITGPLVYAGTTGIWSWTLTLAAAFAWVWCALSHHRGDRARSDRSDDHSPTNPLVWSPVVMAVLVWLVFLAPLVTASRGAESTGAVTAALMGLVVSLWVGFRWVGGELAELEMDPRARRRLRTQVLLRRRFSPQVFWSSLAVSLALGIATSVVYGAV